MSIPEKMLTTREVASLLGVSFRAVQRMRTLGIGPKYKRMGNNVRSKVRYPESFIAEWQASLPTVIPSGAKGA